MNGRGTKEEKSIIAELKNKLGNDYMAYWVCWKYAPDLLPKDVHTFADLVNNYKSLANTNLTERECEKYLYYEKVQNAVRWLLKKQKGARMIALYNLWYEAAKTDANALKEFLKLQDEFFKNDELSELESILKNSAVKDDEGEYEMNI